ncbi:saccharopine dehydrogenase NADP-binding domain-containing protein [Flavobacteriales bacterium]|jgi:saccharopine dehydrogenase-like NADP-dependent oxidoreductase|nr:saccharopine dehydrogenase NADP-binding domain-containing protein [Flavobacteriales bacterium]
MKKILVIGAGRSAVTLIKYLLDNSAANNWQVTLADFSLELAEEAVGSNENGKAIFFNVTDEQQREGEIEKADIVISMLPASLHITVAKDCVRLKKNLVTASYVSAEIAELDEAAKQAGILLLNEIGLDPGIDHMSAMQVIDEIKENGGELTSFKSFCGGLVHPDYDNNPWNYKFTWNPRNVVLAGQGTAQYIENGDYKYIPYTSLFERTEQMEVLDAGEFEGYANRDSLSYRKSYGLKNIPTLFRGTLRRKGYSEAWNVFVQLGMTDDTYKLENSASITNREFINMFLPFDDALTVEEKLCKQFNLTADSVIFQKIAWLGIFSENKSGIKDASPAQILQEICESKWTLGAEDKDMIVMQHQFEYFQNGEQKKLNSSLLVFGDDPRYTSMAKTVGLPVAIATKLILNGEINSTGIKIPTTKDIYVPVLKELEENGINFVEELV